MPNFVLLNQNTTHIIVYMLFFIFHQYKFNISLNFKFTAKIFTSHENFQNILNSLVIGGVLIFKNY